MCYLTKLTFPHPEEYVLQSYIYEEVFLFPDHHLENLTCDETDHILFVLDADQEIPQNLKGLQHQSMEPVKIITYLF